MKGGTKNMVEKKENPKEEKKLTGIERVKKLYKEGKLNEAEFKSATQSVIELREQMKDAEKQVMDILDKKFTTQEILSILENLKLRVYTNVIGIRSNPLAQILGGLS